MKIYVASSWRNRWQPEVVASLRGAGHEVYDFRHPVAGDDGFNWRQVHAKPVDEWLPADYQEALRHPRARESFELDMGALRSADAVVLVLPCGNDAHLEMGWAAGAGKRTVVFIVDEFRPGLMYLMNSTICTDLDQVHVALSIHRRSRAELDAEKWEADARAIPGQGNLHGKSYRLGFVDGRESAPPSPPAERPGAGERCQCGKKAIGEDFWHTVDGCVNRQIGPPAPPAVSEAGPGAESSQRSTNQGGSDGDDDRATDEGAGRGSGSGRGTESADRHEGRGGPREREADAGQGAGAHGGGDPLRRAVASAPAQPQGEAGPGAGHCEQCGFKLPHGFACPGRKLEPAPSQSQGEGPTTAIFQDVAARDAIASPPPLSGEFCSGSGKQGVLDERYLMCCSVCGFKHPGLAEAPQHRNIKCTGPFSDGGDCPVHPRFPSPPPEPRGPQFTEAQVKALVAMIAERAEPKP